MPVCDAVINQIYKTTVHVVPREIKHNRLLTNNDKEPSLDYQQHGKSAHALSKDLV